MSAALPINSPLGAAPASPARLPSSDGAGFAGVLAAAIDGRAEQAPTPGGATPAVPVAPAGPLPAGTVIAAPAGKGLVAKGADATPDATPSGETALAQDAALLASSGARPTSPDEAGATPATPVAPAGKDLTNSMTLKGAGAAPDAIPSGEVARAGHAALLASSGARPTSPDGAGATPATPAAPAGKDLTNSMTLKGAGAAPDAISSGEVTRAGHAALLARAEVQPATPDGAAVAVGEDPAAEPAASATAAAPIALEAALPPAVATGSPPEGLPSRISMLAPPIPTGAQVASTLFAARADVSPTEGVAPAMAGAAATQGLETANIMPAVASPADLGSPIAGAADKVGFAAAATVPVQAQAAFAASALMPKPSPRRPEAAATAAESAQPAVAQAPDLAPDAPGLSAGIEAATSTLPAGNTVGGLAQATGTGTGVASPTSGSPVSAAPPADEAAAAAVLAGADSELSPLTAPVEGHAGEAPPLPESPAPSAASIVLQPMASDSRFNAVAQISAQILRRLEGQTTRFELALTPEDLGRVDVTLEIDGDGGVTARLAFDNPAAAAELRAQVDQLRRELEAAGLNVARDGLQFAERGAHRDDRGTDRRGARAFSGAARLEAETDAGLSTYRVSLADGHLDMRI